MAKDLEKSEEEIKALQELMERQSKNKTETLKRAQSLGIFLNLEFKNGRYRSAIPISIEKQSAIFIEEPMYDTDNFPRRKMSWQFDQFEILGEGYHLESEETVQKNLDHIRNRKSDSIESLEYWNDKIESVVEEDLNFVSEEQHHINVRDADSKPLVIRKPFLRSIIFEGQEKEELLSRLNAPLAKYEGYKFFNLAWEIISERSLEEISFDSEGETVIKLLKKALEDNTISSNTQAKALRILGEISDIKDEKEPAIQFYEKAISLNPNIGLKKRLTQLRAKRKSGD